MTVEYFPELKGFVNKNRDKYGIANLSLVTDKNVIGGLTWRYTYYDMVEEKVKIISSYDIKKLRRNVESKGLKWIVTNVERARETYKLNSKIIVEHERIREENKNNRVANHTISKSGVQYVYMNNTNDNLYWTYRDGKHQTITRKHLQELCNVVQSKGYKWIIKDKEVYENILEREKKQF